MYAGSAEKGVKRIAPAERAGVAMPKGAKEIRLFSGSTRILCGRMERWERPALWMKERAEERSFIHERSWSASERPAKQAR